MGRALEAHSKKLVLFPSYLKGGSSCYKFMRMDQKWNVNFFHINLILNLKEDELCRATPFGTSLTKIQNSVMYSATIELLKCRR